MRTPRRPGQTEPNHILCIVTDASCCHAMTEETIDAWWASLSPEEKADIYLASLEPPRNTHPAPLPAWIQHGLNAAQQPATQQ